MATLWTFGDSFTDFYVPPPNSTKIHWRHKYTEWKGHEPKVYGQIISEKLNLKLINKGLGGVDNLHILEEFCKVSDKIGDDDIVIIGWTNQRRIRLADKRDKWGYFNPEPKNENGFFAHKELDIFDFISENTIQELMVNKMNILYTLEICNWIKLVNLSLKDKKVIHWSWDEDVSKCGIICSEKYKTIRKETNGVVDDVHWCEEGQYLFADFLIKEIFSNTKRNRII